MTPQTAEIVQLLSSNVIALWPIITKKNRLSTSLQAIHDTNHDISDLTKEDLKITIGDELLILTIDGDLGLYYPLDDREPVRISLLTTRTVQVTKVYTIEVPCVGTETTGQILHLAKDYPETLTNTYQEEIENDDTSK